MKKAFYTTAIVAALFGTGPAFVAAQANSGDRVAGKSEAAARIAGAEQNGAAANEDPQEMNREFVKDASNINLFEVQSGQLAAERATDPQIKQLGQQIAQDHQQAQQKLQQAAQAANVQAPSQLDDVHQAMLNHLQKKQGRQFDRAFVYDQVAGHTKAILMFRDASNELQNAQLKQYAEQTLPQLRMHLQEANRACGASEAMPAGAHMRANEGGANSGDVQNSSGSSATGNPGNNETSGARSGSTGNQGGSGTR